MRGHMDDHDIECQNPMDTEETLVFFSEMLKSLPLQIQNRDKSDPGPVLFKGVLEDWVLEYANRPIPQKLAVWELDKNVSWYSIYVLIISLTLASL